MARWLPLIGIGAFLAGGVVAARLTSGPPHATQDLDRDGLADDLEAYLAVTFFPTIHEFAGPEGNDECPLPLTRPVLYRARPRVVKHRVDSDYVAITYVLLYAEDCGALGHVGDDEAFTIFLHHDRIPDRWRTIAASASAHQDSRSERDSVGAGRAIWVSKNKHSSYATFEACDDSGVPGEVCTEDGPSPRSYAFLNVGEPWAHLSNDVGDVMLRSGADPVAARALAPWYRSPMTDRILERLIQAMRRAPAGPSEQANYAYLLFRGHTIWDHRRFLGAGDITAELLLGHRMSSIPTGLEWDAEGVVTPSNFTR
jgi:hypothetical protein